MTSPVLTVCVLLLNVSTLVAQGSAGDAQRLKAAFVLRFPQFVAWPAAAFATRSTLEICVNGPGASVTALREITAGETLNGMRLTVRDNPSERDVASCHVLVMARPSRELMAQVAHLPILTVGDGAAFLDDGGIIQLKLVDRRVRFEISMPAAARAGLTLSSQLLRLAATVRGER